MENGQKKSRPVVAHGCGGSPVSGVTQSECVAPALQCDCSTVLKRLQEEVEGQFRPKHLKSVELGEVYSELDLHTRAFKVTDCGTFLEYHVTETEKKLHKANFCKDRLCPMCNWRRSLKVFGQVSQVMDLLQDHGYRFLFLTLTVKNCPAHEFPATVKMLYQGWRNLYHETKKFKGAICGTFRSLETTINREKQTFHPHFHAILAVKSDYFHGYNYITQKQWSDMWANSCGLAYNPIVHIETVKEGQKGIGGAVAEAAKYAVKDSEFLVGSKGQRQLYVFTLLSGLSGRRLVDMTGCFREARRQLQLDDMEDGDLVHVDGDDLRDDLAYIIVRYQWRNGFYLLSNDGYKDFSRSVERKQLATPICERARGPGSHQRERSDRTSLRSSAAGESYQ